MKKKINLNKKLKKIYKENTLEIITGAGVIVLGLIILIGMLLFQSNIKEYKTDTYTIKYDRSWKRKGKNENTIKLKHKSNSTIYIEVMDLKEEQKYLGTEDIIEELLYNIGLENKEYNILQKEKSNITRHSYEGYKLLYENKTHQALVVVAKKSEKVMLFTYEAKHEYFDILLDSVENIIYNFDINDEKYLINNSIKVDTEEIKFEENKDLLKLLKENKSYDIANKNYSVKISIPSNFQMSSFDSTLGYYTFKDLKKGSINLKVNIYAKNIYEYLEKEEKFGNLYNEFKNHRSKENKSYQDFSESLTKLNHKKYEAYLYKAKFNYVYGEKKIPKESYYMIYELDKNHILVFEIESSENIISKDLINKITFSNVKNYANNITKEKVLKRFSSYKKDKVDEITIKLPNTYKEIDYSLNMYNYRYFALNYNSKNQIYEYNVMYYLSGTSSKLESLVDNISIIKTVGQYQELIPAGTINLNGKEFIVYNGGYTKNGKGYLDNGNGNTYYINKKVLFHQLPTGGYLQIEIDGNGVEISQEVLNDLTNVDIMNTEYE